MAITDFLFGKSEQMKRVPLGSEQQQQAQSQLLSQLMPLLQQRLGAGGQFAPIREAAQQRFQQETLPTIAERFGAHDAFRGSGFGQALGGAAAGLESQLAGQEAQFGQQEMSQLLNLLGMGMQPMEQAMLQQRQPGFLENLTKAGASGLAQGAGMGATGGMGGLASILNLLRSGGGA